MGKESAASSKIAMVKLFFAPILWGGGLIAGRLISAELPPFTTSCVRFIIASVIMLIALYSKERHFIIPTKKELFDLFLVSLTGMVLFNVFLFTSLKTITAVRSSILIAFTPAIVAIAAFFLFKEKISKAMLVGIIGAIIGAILTITEGDFQSIMAGGLAIGDLYMLGAVAAWAAYSLVIKQSMSRLSPLAVLAYASVMGVIILLPLTLFEGAWGDVFHISTNALWALLYLSVFSAGVAYLWYFEGIAVVGSSRASIFLNLEPVAAIFLGIFMLGEHMNWAIGLGAVLVIGSLYIANLKK
ncbi:MAG: DMT family transporter [Sphaerochaetaceae bacterium]|jgi:drug/metabolite transporter (DMT)-like permease